MNLARKSSLFENLEDIVIRLYLQSSPIIRNLMPKSRKSPVKDIVKSPDDLLVESFFDSEWNLIIFHVFCNNEIAHRSIKNKESCLLKLKD